jgi:hypothetical protein
MSESTQQPKVYSPGSHELPFELILIAPDKYIFTTPERDNARRILALWNTCTGIPTEALEAGVIQDMKDALEDALDKINSEYCSHQDGIGTCSFCERASKALAKLEGK